jgi:hypothetical protein
LDSTLSTESDDGSSTLRKSDLSDFDILRIWQKSDIHERIYVSYRIGKSIV